MKLLVVDDHPVFRDGLAALLRQAADHTVILQAPECATALKVAAEHADLDAVFVDLMMPGLSGDLAVREFGKRRPELPVIVLSSSENPSDVRRALKAGALGYIPKSASPQTLLSALQLVLSGNIYIPPLLAHATQPQPDYNSTPQPPLAISQLTDRQIDVLRHLCTGLSNKEISARLGIAEKTVKAHVAAIFKTLNVVNRTQAAHAVRAGQSGLAPISGRGSEFAVHSQASHISRRSSPMIVPDRVRAAQIRSIYRNTPPGLLATSVALGGFTAVLAYIDAVSVQGAAVLIAVIVAQTVARLLLARTHRRSAEVDRYWRDWARRFTAGAIVGGLTIGGGISWIMSTGRVDVQAISLLMVCAFTSGAVVAFGAYLPAFIWFFIAASIGPMAWLIIHGGVLYSSLAVMYVIWFGAVVELARRTSASFTESVMLRFENLDLVETCSARSSQPSRRMPRSRASWRPRATTCVNPCTRSACSSPPCVRARWTMRHASCSITSTTRCVR
jgi:DNA-binding NarL/FixJ family response regulator